MLGGVALQFWSTTIQMFIAARILSKNMFTLRMKVKLNAHTYASRIWTGVLSECRPSVINWTLLSNTGTRTFSDSASKTDASDREAK